MNTKIYEVNEFAEALKNQKHLKKMKKMQFIIAHPLLENGFESLVKVIDSFSDLK